MTVSNNPWANVATKSKTTRKKRKTPARTKTRTPSSNGGVIVDTGLLRNLSWFSLKILMYGGLGLGAATMLGYIHAPWVAVGRHFAGDSMGAVWGYEAARYIPLFGGWLSRQMQDPVMMLGSAIMASVNACQLFSLLQALGHLDSLSDTWAARLTLFSFFAWIIETIVAVSEYPIYHGGMGAFIDGFPFSFSASDIIWTQVFSASILMFSFEASLTFGVMAMMVVKHYHRRGARA